MPNASNSDARKRAAERAAAGIPRCEHGAPVWTCADENAATTPLARVAALADDLDRGSGLVWSSTVAKAIREALDGAA